ncbi:MAG: flagellar filament capping protein FliD [Lachnospiraceae bacterium]|nr:flagellar filament capping protein FliD [Candidatus Merdinaster equi]
MIRITGMNSGLDTDGIIKELTAARNKKKEKLVKSQTRMEWKQDSWKTLNSKIKSFYSSTLSNMRFQSSFKKKKTTSSNTNVATVVAGDNAVNGTQSLIVKNTAKAGYLTGGKLETTDKKRVNSATTLSQLNKDIAEGDSVSFSVTAKGKTTNIDLTGSSKISDVISQLNKAGVTASFDETNQRIFVSSSASGSANDFSITANNVKGLDALSGLGLLTSEELSKNTEGNAALAAAYDSATGKLNSNGDSYVNAKAQSYAASLQTMANLSNVDAAYDKIKSLTEDWENNKKTDYENAQATIALYDNDPAKIAERQNAIDERMNQIAELSNYASLLQKESVLAEGESLSETDAKRLENYRTSIAEKSELDALTAKKEGLGEGESLTEEEEARLTELSSKKFYDLSGAEAAAPDYDDYISGLTAEKADLESEKEELSAATTAINDYKAYQAEVEAQSGIIKAAAKNAVILNDYYADANSDMLAGISGTTYAEKLAAVQTSITEKTANGEDTTELESQQALLQKMADNEAIINGKDFDTYEVDSTGALSPKNVANAIEAEDITYDAASQGIKERATTTVTNEAMAAYEVANNSSKYLTANNAVRVLGQDAEILLNGASFTSSNNTFSINGLTITAKSASAVTGSDKEGNPIYEELSISTEDDVDGIYDMVKNFIKEYNKLIKEIDTLYGADAAKKYDPLTSEEKDAMTDDEIEKWEQKIKDGLLSGDSDLGTVRNMLKSAMSQSIMIDGKNMSLSSFGIETMGYFGSAENERGVYRIDGDKEDETTGAFPDKLKKMIASDPDTVSSFFSKLAGGLYSSMMKLSRSTTNRSYGNFYDDKSLKDQYTSYGKKIKSEEDKIADMEDKYYKQFAQMESAMAKINSTSNYIGNMMGGGM